MAGASPHRLLLCSCPSPACSPSCITPVTQPCPNALCCCCVPLSSRAHLYATVYIEEAPELANDMVPESAAHFQRPRYAGASVNSSADYALRKAAGMGDTAMVRLLLRRGARVEAGQYDALYQAARSGSWAVVQVRVVGMCVCVPDLSACVEWHDMHGCALSMPCALTPVRADLSCYLVSEHDKTTYSMWCMAG